MNSEFKIVTRLPTAAMAPPRVSERRFWNLEDWTLTYAWSYEFMAPPSENAQQSENETFKMSSVDPWITIVDFACEPLQRKFIFCNLNAEQFKDKKQAKELFGARIRFPDAFPTIDNLHGKNWVHKTRLNVSNDGVFLLTKTSSQS